MIKNSMGSTTNIDVGLDSKNNNNDTNLFKTNTGTK